LRNGILASYAAADALLGSDAGVTERYAGILNEQFAGYEQAYRRYFAQETRWPESPFWMRRQTATAPPLEETAWSVSS
jgi:hypothetical protein